MRRFEQAATSFDDADFVHAVTRDGLLSRLQPLEVDAKQVIDLGSATSSALRSLNKRFSRAHIVAVDIARNMLRKGRAKKSWLAKASFVQGSASSLPFADESIDVVFANMLLPWVDELSPVFSEVARVLRKGGVFAFATLGPDSLAELRRAWRRVDADAHINHFMDMHDLGDGLVHAGLSDPVLDVDRLTVSYRNAEKVFSDLTAAGARNALLNRRSSLTGTARFAAMRSELESHANEDKIELELELVFGHCWGAGRQNDRGSFRIDATQIPLRRR